MKRINGYLREEFFGELEDSLRKTNEESDLDEEDSLQEIEAE